jgi:hypothetical protein
MFSFSDFIFKLKRRVSVMVISREALDAEMNRCVAELRMLGADAAESTEFNAFLNEISNRLESLYNAVPADAISTKLAARLLGNSVTRAVNAIVKSKIDTDRGWVKCLKAVRNVSDYAGSTLKPLSVLVHPNFAVICEEIEISLATDVTYSIAGTERRKLYIRTKLKSLGQNLARLNEQGIYSFLDEAPRHILLDLIDFLQR